MLLQRSIRILQRCVLPVHGRAQHRLGVPPLLHVGPSGRHESLGCEHRLDLGWLTDGSVRADRFCDDGFYIPGLTSVGRVQQERLDDEFPSGARLTDLFHDPRTRFAL